MVPKVVNLRGHTGTVIEQFLTSRSFLIFTFVWFGIQSVFIALSTRIGIPPDESYHLEFVRLLTKNGWLPFIHNQSGSYDLGEVAHTPFFLYQYLLSIINHFLGDGTIELFILRIINMLLGAASIWLVLKIANKLRISAFARNIALFILANTLMFVFLSSGISYDNLLIPLALASVLTLMNFIDSPTARNLGVLLLCLLAGSMTAINFLPIGATVLIILIYRVLRRWRYSIQKIRKSMDFNPLNIVLVIALILLAALFIQRYIYNLAAYHAYAPGCTTTLTVEQCSKNHIYARTVRLDNSVRPKATKTLVEYVPAWWDLMNHRIYGIFSHKSIQPSSVVLKTAEIFMIVGFLFLIRMYNRQDGFIGLLIVISAVYTFVLLLTNWRAYQRYGSFTFAVQGRYLLLVLPLMYLVFCRYIFDARHFLARYRILLASILVVIFIGSSLPVYIYKTTPAWHTNRSRRLNENLRSALIHVREKL